YGIKPPRLLAGIHIEGCNETTNSDFASRCADDDLAIGHQWRERHVIAFLVVFNNRRPDFFSCPGVERNEYGFSGCEKILVFVERNTTTGRMQYDAVLEERAPVAPENCTGPGIECDDLVTRSRNEHDTVVYNRRR